MAALVIFSMRRRFVPRAKTAPALSKSSNMFSGRTQTFSNAAQTFSKAAPMAMNTMRMPLLEAA